MIGILGYHGFVGKTVLNYLSNQYLIRCGGRQIQEEKITKGIEYVKVDVDDTNSLKNFCQGCDVIINCIGPSYFFAEKILGVVEKVGAAYIDAFGVNLFSMRKAYTIPVVVGAGSFPGLSGMLPAWIKQNKNLEPEKIKIFAGGKERITQTACIDFLSSIINRFGKSGIYYTAQGLKNENGIVTLPEVFSRNEIGVSYLTEELIQAAYENKVKELHWYSVQSYSKYNEVMAEAIIHLMKDSSYENMKRISNSIIQNMTTNTSVDDLKYRIVIEVQNDKKFLLERYVWETDDSYVINGAIAAYCAKKLYEERYENGIFWPFQILNAFETVEKLVKNNVLKVRQFQSESVLGENELEDEEI